MMMMMLVAACMVNPLLVLLLQLSDMKPLFDVANMKLLNAITILQRIHFATTK